jgi:membrane-associated phospholipid phosphatase
VPAPTSLEAVGVSSRTLLLGVAGCAGLFFMILFLAYLSPAARDLDAQALQGFVGLQNQHMLGVTRRLSHLGDEFWVGLQGAILATVALLRGRARAAVAVVALLAVTSVSSQLLKALFAYPRPEAGFARVAAEAFPSGHSTAIMSLAIAGVIVAPPRIRPLAALVGCAIALAVALSLLSHGSHFPSDVAGGFLLATGWGLLTALALRWADGRWPERRRTGPLATAFYRTADTVATAGVAAAVLAGAVLVLVLAIGVALTRPGDLLDLARDHTAALLVGSALAALAIVLLTGITLGLRRRS